MNGLSAAQWRWLVFRLGDHVCPTHGPVSPAEGLVSHCTEPVDDVPCMRIVLRVVPDRSAQRPGKVMFAWPQPAECPAGHLLAPGTVSLTWAGCRCTPAGGHRVWHCGDCGRDAEPPMWPPPCPLWRESRRR